MERKMGFFGGVICILTITVLVLAKVATAKVEEYDYYKIVLTWSPSFCNDVQNDCVGEILDYFTLYALVPMYSTHRAVPPYYTTKAKGSRRDSKCTNKRPMRTKDVKIKIASFDEPLRQAMDKYMVNLKNPKNKKSILQFQLGAWERHGMCYGNPEDPTDYYKTAVALPKRMNLTKILEEEGDIVPSNERSYNIATVARHITTSVTKRPRIHCNRDNGKMQLLEIDVCFLKNGQVRDCPSEFYECEGSDYIWFPSAK